MLQNARVRASVGILDSLRSNPYLKGNEAAAVAQLIKAGQPTTAGTRNDPDAAPAADPDGSNIATSVEADEAAADVPDEAVSAYLVEHATEIAAEKDKPFQPVGGIVDLLGSDYFPVVENREMAKTPPEPAKAPAGPAAAAKPAAAFVEPSKRDNAVQKINRLDVKGRIQLAMKGNKEERSILIRDGTKVVALAVLDAPKISDGEVEKFALQKNVLEAVLRQIPLKRRFMKNYIVVRNLVSNPRTPLDLGLGLMKHLMTQDLKNISANKEVSETVRKLALKMYKQKLDMANRK